MTRLAFVTMAMAMVLLPAAAAGPQTGPPAAAHGPRVSGASFEKRDVSRQGLDSAVRAIAGAGRPAWIGYAVPAIEGQRRTCCFGSLDSIDKYARCCATCRLEERQSYGSFSGDGGGATVRLEPSGAFMVLLRVDGGRVGRIRAFSEDCALDSGSLPFYQLEGVETGDSLDYLSRFVSAGHAGDREDGEEGLTGQALNAIAMHAAPQADRLLERFVATGRPFEVRAQAAFWIGQSRGRPGYEILKRLVADDPDPRFRRKVLFALSQNPTPEATDTLIAAAHSDREPEVRGEAIFWLAQKAGDKAARVISEAIENDPQTEVKKKAVFALTQLPDDEGIPLLIELAKSHRNPAVRKEAIFWLGQSGDPRALDLIERILRS